MKKLFCFLLCLTLIFSSVSLSFAATADWTTTDQQNLQNVASRLFYMNQSAAYYLYNIASNTNNIYNKCVDIYNALFYSNHNISYWVNSINSWMSPIYNAVTQTPLNLEKIWLSLGYTTDIDNDGNLEYHPYLLGLDYLQKALTNTDYYNQTTGLGAGWAKTYAHRSLFRNVYDFNGRDIGAFIVPSISNNGTVGSEGYYWNYGSPIGNLALMMQQMLFNDAYIYKYQSTGNTALQTAINWGSLSNSTFTPQSDIDGIYKWFSAIQAPVARLSYVLANDQEIEARDAAAANQETVVDNFIDSSGDGAASPSDISSVSGLSSGYKQNFGSDASPSGIFDIFNSDHATWFSQETKNQLDTTIPTRLTKGSESETPLLDKQIEDIYNALGVKQP